MIRETAREAPITEVSTPLIVVQMKTINEACNGDEGDESKLEGTPPQYKAMIVTPGGSIIAIGNPNKIRKPETDPDWEEHEEERKAQRAARRAVAKRPRKL